MHPSDVVLKFVASIGRPAEVELYLSLFRSARPESFAIISASREAISGAGDALALDLRFLSLLGLCPVIAFGASEPDGAREDAENVQRRLAGEVACAIVAPERAGVTAAASCLALVPLEGGAGDADAGRDSLAELAAGLGTRKLVFLEPQSGLRPTCGEALSLVNLAREYEALSRPGRLAEPERLLLGRIRRVLARVPHRMTAAVTSPIDLLRELFTERGAGTLIRRGSAIRRHPDMADIDRDRLEWLLESAFDRRPLPAIFARQVTGVFVADDYRGAAVVTPTPLAPYLSKFAVEASARGEGVGRDLWEAVVGEFPALFWRSRPHNPITAWYRNHCDGMVRAGPWTVFWRGIDVARAADLVAHARAAPEDFAPRDDDA